LHKQESIWLEMKPKIIFLDMEGTLLQTNKVYDNGKVAPSAWTVLAARLGEACLREEEETKNRWKRREYPNYMSWMLDTVRIHKKYRLTRNVFVEVMDAVEWTHGLEDAFRVFHEWNSITVLISGGFKYHADRLQARLKIGHSFCGCEYFFDSKTGLIDHFNLLPADEKGKVDFMKLMTAEYEVSPDECAFVGDGMNDVPLAQVVGCSVAFNAQAQLKAVASVVVEQPDGKEDFRAVVESIDQWSAT
jgi:phosphoserine phosphatase